VRGKRGNCPKGGKGDAVGARDVVPKLASPSRGGEMRGRCPLQGIIDKRADIMRQEVSTLKKPFTPCRSGKSCRGIGSWLDEGSGEKSGMSGKQEKGRSRGGRKKRGQPQGKDMCKERREGGSSDEGGPGVGVN